MLRIVLLAVLLLATALPVDAKVRFSDEETFDPAVLRINEDAYLGQTAPDILMTDEQGTSRTLRSFAGKPLVLLFIYFDCPVMCPLLGDELAKGLGGVKDLAAGRDYNVLVLSFNKDDTPEKARQFRRKLEAKQGALPAWTFATAQGSDIDALTKSAGYRFYPGRDGQFVHPNVYLFLSPDQKISRYLFGVRADPFSLRLAILESAKGRTGKFALSSLLTMACYRYDGESRGYVLSLPVLFGSGGVVMAGMTGVLVLFVSRKKKALQLRNEGGNR